MELSCCWCCWCCWCDVVVEWLVGDCNGLVCDWGIIEEFVGKSIGIDCVDPVAFKLFILFDECGFWFWDWFDCCWCDVGGKNGYGNCICFPLLLLLLLLLLLPCMRLLLVLPPLINCWKLWKSLFIGRYVDRSLDDWFCVADSLRASAVCHSPVAVTFVQCHGLI